MKNRKTALLILIITACCLLMCFIDGVITPPYAVKSVFKIILFLAVPIIYFIFDKDSRKTFKVIFTPRKKDFLISLLLGAAVYAVILCGYFCLKDHFDFSNIVTSLTSGVGVSKDNFLFVAIYISFVNSLLEEFFFRGFAFLTLKSKVLRGMAYAISSALFAFYHAGMTSGWFNPFLYILMMIGLFIGGCIFNFLNEKCLNIYPSWLVHMFANFGINTVGCILFGII